MPTIIPTGGVCTGLLSADDVPSGSSSLDGDSDVGSDRVWDPGTISVVVDGLGFVVELVLGLGVDDGTSLDVSSFPWWLLADGDNLDVETADAGSLEDTLDEGSGDSDGDSEADELETNDSEADDSDSDDSDGDDSDSDGSESEDPESKDPDTDDDSGSGADELGAWATATAAHPTINTRNLIIFMNN
ncbi:hypothetical protein LPJ70_006980 [Coemansia sp. RSA 2708]|nr:hypothetical protein LPJ70_006980 [Coemansia sp. RSA 2708]